MHINYFISYNFGMVILSRERMGSNYASGNITNHAHSMTSTP